VVCALALLLIQVAVAHRLSYGILRFDLLYLLAAYMALEASPRGALGSALFIGLLRDMGSTGPVGAGAVVVVLGVGATLWLRGRVYREMVLTDVVLVFLFVLLCGGLEATGLALLYASAQWGALMGCAFGQAVLTAALCPLMFAAYRRAGVLERHGASPI